MTDRQPDPVAAVGRPGPKTAALVTLAFAAVLSAYLLGRATPPPIERALPQPTQLPTAPLSQVVPNGPIADLSGSGDLLAKVNFGDTRQALVLCRRVGSPSRDRITVSYLDTSTDPARLLGHEEIEKTVFCGDCEIGVIDVAGDQVGLGTCPTVIIRGAFEPNPATNMAFVVAQPSGGIRSAIGLVIDCGVTSLVSDGDELVLNGQQPPAGQFAGSSYPPIRFGRRGLRFFADDLPLLRHFCNADGSHQLSGYPANEERWVAGRTVLAHLEMDSSVGVIGVRRQVLIGLTPQQCETLFDTRNNRSDEATEPVTSLAEITGLDPPDGADDWYLTCQFD